MSRQTKFGSVSRTWRDFPLILCVNFPAADSRTLEYPVLQGCYHACRNCRLPSGMSLLRLLRSVFGVTALNIVKIPLLSAGSGCRPALGYYFLLYFRCSCHSVARRAFPAELLTWFFCLTTGDHCPFGKTPFAHPLQELHDDQCPERQSRGELHDDHDCHAVSGEKEHRRMLVLLSGALGLSLNVSLCES